MDAREDWTRSADPSLIEVSARGSGDDEVALIVQLSGSEPLPEGVRVVTRFKDIATLRVRRDRIAALAQDPSVIAMEASRRLRLLDPADVRAAARSEDPAALQSYVRRPAELTTTGKGCTVGLIDFGIDFAFPAFRREDGSTRILAIWDQRARPGPAVPGNRWGYGRVITREEIDRALQAEDPYAALGYDPSDADAPDRETGEPEGSHGTHTTDICCGNGRGGGLAGVAPESDIVFVHLARTSRVVGKGTLGDAASLLEALDFLFSVAGERPCAINVSIGAHGGPHDGTTLVEIGIDRAVLMKDWRAVVISAGNYRLAKAHAHGRLREGETRSVAVDVPGGDPTESELELYYDHDDALRVTVVAPSGARAGEAEPGHSAPIVVEGAEVGRIYHYARDMSGGDHHVEVVFRAHAPAGRWEVRLDALKAQDGRWHAWIERDQGLRPTFDERDVAENGTTGTLCNGKLSITVGAYDPHAPERPIAAFSSAGPTRDGRIKPELLAPGVRICAARSTPAAEQPGARFVSKDGTSMAAPHVTGAIALMFEAAGRPVSIADLRALLFASATCPAAGDAAHGLLDLHRRGYGYLDIVAAEQAARRWGESSTADVYSDAASGVAPVDTAERVLASPRQRFDGHAEPGDVLVRFAAAEGITRSALVLSSGEPAERLLRRGIPVESAGPGLYAAVSEASPPYGRRVIGRRLTDASGRMLPGQTLARPAAGAGALPADRVIDLISRVSHATVFSEAEGLFYFLWKHVKKVPHRAEQAGRALRTQVLAAAREPAWRRSLLTEVVQFPYAIPFVRGALAALAVAADHLPWIKYFGVDLSIPEEAARLKQRVLTLPAPGTRAKGGPVKYLVVSDLHRDRPDDAFAGGPITHFSKNKRLYMRVLEYARRNGHTLIENGDAEEFWAVPDLGKSAAARAQEIYLANRDVYAMLGALHREGRYYRTRGNHDSDLRDPRALALLTEEWGRGVVPWDFILMPGVKTMDEFTWLDLLRGKRKPLEYVGLTPDAYTKKKCLIVCHGHQFDFWNCEENETLGRLVTAMFRYPDGWMDDLLRYEGIHVSGNPFVEVADLLGAERNLVFNHWLERQPALVRAHGIQHQRSGERLLRDSFMYSETLTALLGTLAMPVSRCGPGAPATALRDRLGHAILVGHTHYPQSQPHYPLGDALALVAPKIFPSALAAAARTLGALASPVRMLPLGDPSRLITDILNGIFKSRYFNSGVGGWHEGVLYAIEVTEGGQARLLYWTDGDADPREMDWELTPKSAPPGSASAALKADAAWLLERACEALKTLERELGGTLESLLGVFGRGMDSLLDAVSSGAGASRILGTGAVVLGGKWRAQLQLSLTEFMTAVARKVHLRQGVEPAVASLEIHVPWTARERRVLEEYAADISASGLLPPDRAFGATQLAMVWMFAQEFAPYYGPVPSGPAPRDALRGAGALLCMLPVRANIGPAETIALETRVTADDSRLIIQLRVVPPAPRQGPEGPKDRGVPVA